MTFKHGADIVSSDGLFEVPGYLGVEFTPLDAYGLWAENGKGRFDAGRGHGCRLGRLEGRARSVPITHPMSSAGMKGRDGFDLALLDPCQNALRDPLKAPIGGRRDPHTVREHEGRLDL
jgi:hypothetical protein